MNILGIIGLVILLFVLYKLFHRERIAVYMKEDGRVAPYIKAMKSLDKPYFPTPWLPEANIQTMWGMRYREKHLDYRRELFVLEDGGTVALDYFDPPEDVKDPPIVMVIHTLAGGTREPCSNNLCETFRKMGFRAFVFNNRGCSGVPFTSRRFYNASLYDDVQAVIAHVRELYEPKFFFLVGFSLGAYTAIEYDLMDGGVDAVACISHTYHAGKANEILSEPIQKKLYLPVMIAKLTHILKKNQFVNYPEALKVKTLDAYDREFTAKEYNIKDLKAYHAASAIAPKIKSLKAPTLVLGCDNDPFTYIDIQPRKEASESENCAFLRVQSGGHVSFPSGLRAETTLQDIIVPDFFKSVMEIKSKKSE